MARKLSKLDIQSILEEKLLQERIAAKERAWETIRSNHVKPKDDNGTELPRSNSGN